MADKQNNPVHNTRRKPHVIPPNEVVQNPNPTANENIRVHTEEPKTQNNQSAHGGAGSEITDGEDA
jgi:hypothetical protein